VYFALAITLRLLWLFAGESRHGMARRLSRMLSDLDAPGGAILAMSIAQIALAIAIFFARKRRAVMWGSLAIASMSVAMMAIIIIGTGTVRFNMEGGSQNMIALGLFGALAWLHRPGVRNERSLAAIFE